MKTIALFGGSFDPPHLGHEAIVNALNELAYIDKIVVMPTFLNPFKSSSFAPAKLRLKWLREAFVVFSKVEVSSYEVSQNEKVATIKTVEYLLRTYEKIYLVIGADNLASLEHWHRFDELSKKVTFIVATREKTEVSQEFITLEIDEKISSSELREKIDINYLPKKVAKEIMKYYKENNE